MEEMLNDYFSENKSTILNSLLYDDKTLDELSNILKINKNAVKEHINYLENKNLVSSYFLKAKTGRPKKYYKLTEKGMQIFPKQYINFSSLLLKEIENEYGTAKLNNILMKIADKMIHDVDTNDMSLKSLTRDEKIEKLKNYVNILNKLGYYAKMEIEDNHVRIIRHNCIFYELAKNNKELVCGSLEKSLINDSLGNNFTLLENFPDGNNKCVVEINL